MEKFNNIYKEVIESYSQNTEQILDTTNKTEVQRTYELFVEKCRMYNFPIMLTPEEFVNIFVENNKYCTIRQKHEIEKIADEYYFEFEKKDDEREIRGILDEQAGVLRRNAANFTDTSPFCDFKDRTLFDIKNIIYKKFPNIDMARGYQDFSFDLDKLINDHINRYQIRGENDLRSLINSLYNVLENQLGEISMEKNNQNQIINNASAFIDDNQSSFTNEQQPESSKYEEYARMFK